MNVIDGILKDKEDIKRQLGEVPDIKIAPKRFTSNTRVKSLVIKQVTKSIAGSMIWGSEEYGVWGEDSWGSTSGSSFILNSEEFGVLGTNKLGSSGTEEALWSVLPRNNVYQEFFSQDLFINTNNTTAAIDYTNEIVTMQSGDVLESEVIAKLREPILFVNFREHADFIDINDSATFPFILGTTTFGETDVSIEVSNDSGTTWHEIQEGTRFDFPTSSNDDGLKYRITNVGGEVITITKPLNVAVNKL